MAKGLWVVLNVENVDKSLEFYKMLGLKTKAETMEQMNWGSVTLSPDSGLVIWDRRNVGPNQEQADLKAWLSGDLGKGLVLTVGVPNAKTIWAKVSNLFDIDQPLREEPWGGQSFSVIDPDGFVVNITDTFPQASPTKKRTTTRRTATKAKRAAKAKPKRRGR
ncbi:MAG: VOC family protein [Thermoplasmatota archaeon]